MRRYWCGRGSLRSPVPYGLSNFDDISDKCCPDGRDDHIGGSNVGRPVPYGSGNVNEVLCGCQRHIADNFMVGFVQAHWRGHATRGGRSSVKVGHEISALICNQFGINGAYRVPQHDDSKGPSRCNYKLRRSLPNPYRVPRMRGPNFDRANRLENSCRSDFALRAAVKVTPDCCDIAWPVGFDRILRDFQSVWGTW